MLTHNYTNNWQEWRFWWAAHLRNLRTFTSYDTFERAIWRQDMRRCAHWYAVNRGWRDKDANIND